ncbi:DEAD/DEAH box helicase [Francisellaceae bacterium]|nr:DEAD/DEAH box helicase [Francisellaceae bacterium]
MRIIHIFWKPETKEFHNGGQFYLWVEAAAKQINKLVYAYQLPRSELLPLFETLTKHKGTLSSQNIYVPYNQANDIIPSPVIANLNNCDDITTHHYDKVQVNTIELIPAFEILKDINFQSYYFDDDIALGDDAKFWIKMADEMSRVIQADQYIPSVVAHKKASKITYHTKWQPVSSHYQQRLKQISACMPFSACLGNFILIEPHSVLKHFSEVALTNMIAQTMFPQKSYKLVEGSFIEQCLDVTTCHIDESIWKAWKLWQNNLAYDQFGAPFQVCFRLNSATDKEQEDWSLEVLLQSKEDPSFMINLEQYWLERKAKNKLFTQLLGTSVERSLLLQIGYASRIYPLLETIFQQDMQCHSIPLDTEAAFQYLREDAWSLQACGYRIIVPSWWTSKGRLKAKVKLRASKNSSGSGDSPTSYFSKEGLLSFDYQYAIGEHQVSEAEWRQLIESKSELVYFRGVWIEIDVAEMQKMQTLIESSKKDKLLGSVKDILMMSADDDLYEVDYDDSIEEMLNKLRDKDLLATQTQPELLKATLRPYQSRGLSWLAYLEELGMNPCLADDMGLGKTMQIIALLLLAPKEGAALLVAPTSVVGNWFREIQKFAPSLNVMVHHGSDRKQDAAFQEALKNHDMIITSYGLIRRDKNLFEKKTWSRLIIDEAQNIKNPSATQTKILYKIPAQSRIALTGTPIENRLMDLWSLFHFLNPGYLGTRPVFRKGFELPIQRNNDAHQTKILKSLVEPFILRRLKSDKNIIQDLPDKVEQKVYCELTKEQASIYQNIVDEVETEMSKATEAKQKNAVVLSALLRLKQCCNHPAQVLQDGSVFSVERSMKLQRLVEMTKEVISNRESILIFSQFKEVCDALHKMLKTEYGYTTYYLHGGTSRKKREEMIEQFQAEQAPPGIFILSLKAGGVGITLTKANHVIHFDRWWNPAVENQATDRAYRISQQKTVFAHKYITIGTVEERIDQMLTDKQKVSDMIVGNDESWLSKLDAKSFMKLIRLSQSSLDSVQSKVGEDQDVHA